VGATAVREWSGWLRGIRGGMSQRTLVAGLVLFGGLAVTSLIEESPPASAATAVSLYVAVGDTGDCTTQANACGSINFAIGTARDAAYAGDDVTINVAPGTYYGSATVDASSLGLLTIAGAGASSTTVNGNGGASVFDVEAGTVTISHLTVTNGGLEGIEASGGMLTIDSSTVSGNNPVADEGIAGSGILNTGTMTINSSTVSDNGNASTQAGDVGGGISNRGTMTINSSTVSGNSASFAGGISNLAKGTLTINSSTVSDNNTYGSGVVAPIGGGISNEGMLTIRSSTISGNSARLGGGFSNKGKLKIGASIVADNSGGNCDGGANASVGYNLTNDANGTHCGLTASTDVVNANPHLGALGYNGGPTKTFLPAQSSPAIAAIPTGTTLDGVQVCPRDDQREVPSYGKCTIGAVEGGFLITTSALPNATPGKSYKPFQLTAQEVRGSSNPYKSTVTWAQQAVVSPATAIPKGMTLSAAGILAGTPGVTLPPEHSSIRIPATETVTTVNGTQKVITKKTVETSIPLTIT
jgi:hypothetical protein